MPSSFSINVPRFQGYSRFALQIVLYKKSLLQLLKDLRCCN